MLGYHLGFTYDDIYKAYFAKNQINFKRQEENY
jgi:dimeric dUTPase (all-alpha-NTP-PPase superfamily)